MKLKGWWSGPPSSKRLLPKVQRWNDFLRNPAPTMFQLRLASCTMEIPTTQSWTSKPPFSPSLKRHHHHLQRPPRTPVQVPYLFWMDQLASMREKKLNGSNVNNQWCGWNESIARRRDLQKGCRKHPVQGKFHEINHVASRVCVLHKRTSLPICQRILLHLLRYLVHNFSSEDSSSGDEKQASDLDDKAEQTSCKLELTASQVKFMLEDSD